MPSLTELLDETVRAARARGWPAYRARFAALREALVGSLSYADEELLMRLDTLHAAAPEHDPHGCLAELEALAALLRARGMPDGDVGARPVTLDLRGLQPPEPIMRIFEALENAPRAPLRAILPHEPVALYRLLREHGFSCTGAPRADGGFEILIEPS
jgi:hypothetical protein